GAILRTLRNNQGYTLQQLSKKIGLIPSKISDIESSRRELPTEQKLRQWLTALGCKDNLNHLLLLARTYRIKHWVSLNQGDSSNPDIVRIMDTYRIGELSHYDRLLMTLIGRGR